MRYSFFLFVSSQSLIAHNGSVAYAYPIDDISIDGNLDDWPSGMHKYPIQLLEAGDLLESKQDFNAYFRIGYNLREKAIFLAVEIIDQSLFLDSSINSSWNTHDGIELYLDPTHLKAGSPITQYSMYGMDRSVLGNEATWDDIEMNMSVTKNGRIYEWRINLEQRLEIGRSMAFDLAIMDKDQDNSYSWISWGEHTQKIGNPNYLGDLVLVEPGTQMISITGKVDRSNINAGVTSIPVQLSHRDHPRLWLQTFSDSLGNYNLMVPLGQYLIDVPSQLTQVDNDYYRIALSQPQPFNAKPGSSPAIVTPIQTAGPTLNFKAGILHNFDQKKVLMLDQIIEEYQEFYGIPGVSLALIKDGKIVYHNTYGVKSMVTKEPVIEETMFEAASVTKPVFAFAVLRLAERDIIDLDKPLHEYLAFESLEPYPEYKKMTARHVLTHRSGLPNWGAELENTPGTKFGYSGEGFEYLKRVVVHIMAKDIEQILDKEVIDLLDLMHMEFSDSEQLQKVVATGHVGNQPSGWPIPEHAGMASTLHTEAKAFSKFAIAILEHKGLHSDTYKEFTTIHTESSREWWKEEDHREGVGLGIFIRETDYGKAIGHGGNNGDFKCMFEIYEELNMGYVIFTNSDMGDALFQELPDLLVEGGTSN